MTLDERVARIERLLAPALDDADAREERDRIQAIRDRERQSHGQNFTPAQIEQASKSELARRNADPVYRQQQEAKEANAR